MPLLQFVKVTMPRQTSLQALCELFAKASCFAGRGRWQSRVEYYLQENSIFSVPHFAKGNFCQG